MTHGKELVGTRGARTRCYTVLRRRSTNSTKKTDQKPCNLQQNTYYRRKFAANVSDKIENSSQHKRCINENPCTATGCNADHIQAEHLQHQASQSNGFRWVDRPFRDAPSRSYLPATCSAWTKTEQHTLVATVPLKHQLQHHSATLAQQPQQLKPT